MWQIIILVDIVFLVLFLIAEVMLLSYAFVTEETKSHEIPECQKRELV